MRRFKNRRVVIHTKDDQSIRGILTGVHADCFRLRAPEFLDRAKEAPTNFPGEAVVLKQNVSWFQVLEG